LDKQWTTLEDKQTKFVY